MPTPGPDPVPLRDRIKAAGVEGRWLRAKDEASPLADLMGESRLPDLTGRRVLVRTQRQFAAVRLLIDLDGVAEAIALCPPDLDDGHLPHVIAAAGIDAVVGDRPLPSEIDPSLAVSPEPPRPRPSTPAPAAATRWLLFTSGTTGRPKLAAHGLDGLLGAVTSARGVDPPVWATFYDVRRYGGLQALLRGLTGGGSMVLTEADEAIAPMLERLGAFGVTHLSGTPSHWRRALMSPALAAPPLRAVRLSGEIADQGVLDALRVAFPRAVLTHAYASTEAGVGFEVADGLAGFPASFLGVRPGGVELAVVDGALRIRSPRAASGYVGPDAPPLQDEDGFVDTGDMVERRGERLHFVGRRNGVINVGGLKIHPEEVEAVINRHPGVRMSRVRGRRSPLTGAVVAAEVVPCGPGDAALKASILQACRAELTPYKTPASLAFVEALATTAGGKLARDLA